MSEPSHQVEIAAAAPQQPDRDKRRRLQQSRSLALAALGLVAIVGSLYLASPVLLPVLAASFFALLLNPWVRWLSLRGLPRWLAASLIVGLGLAALTTAGYRLYEPAMEAAADSPRVVYQLKRKLNPVQRKLEDAGAVGEALDMIDEIGGKKPKQQTVAVVDDPPGMRETLGGMVRAAITVFSIIMLVYFFLTYGEVLFRRIITVAPNIAEKRRRVAIIRAIQIDVSRYVATITLINATLALVTAGVLYLLGVEDYLLWGALIGLFNYAPYVGPLCSFVLLLGVGILQFSSLADGIAPALAFLILHGIEGQLVTPLVLGRNLSLNPLIILVWLMFWGWLWGIPGLLLGVPLLVSAKIVCTHTPSLNAWARLLEK
ncbi:MAG: AI-2E family transporter [Rhodanobacteraceae bacterium]|nr:AI-2E family transporter [Rhodanobacteraceae bacterium]HPF74587.1 AI-2E family transporter [Xanthomonadaceae bacterium]HRY00880.1 AI-2E family transporter [Xanthomonadaceae bacterium]